ncbi:MAG: hypothetical protein KAV82_14910 [Phycisphaerae bacterium]|nr:hypothetical protein [Phycisphaerae bacterium]
MIVAVGSSGSDNWMLQMLQQRTQEQGGASVSTPPGVRMGGGPGGEGRPGMGVGSVSPPRGAQREELWSKLESYAQDVGMSAEDLESLTSDIDSAVTSVLENMDESNDPRQVVADTIAGVLEDHGIEPESLKPTSEEMGGMSMPFGADRGLFSIDQGSWLDMQA